MTREGCSFSQNTPPTAYRKGCRCPECREVRREQNRTYHQANREAGWERGQARRRRQRATAPGVVTGPWSPAEDAVLAGWEFTTLALAQALGRTYGSIASRRARLRKKGLLPLP